MNRLEFEMVDTDRKLTLVKVDGQIWLEFISGISGNPVEQILNPEVAAKLGSAMMEMAQPGYPNHLTWSEEHKRHLSREDRQHLGVSG